MMSYREEMSRIRQNKLNGYLYKASKGTTLEILQQMQGFLVVQRENHEELLRHNWDKLGDPGSELEMWLYVMADMNEVIRRLEKEVLPHDCNGTCSECLVEVE